MWVKRGKKDSIKNFKSLCAFHNGVKFFLKDDFYYLYAPVFLKDMSENLCLTTYNARTNWLIDCDMQILNSSQ